MLELNNLDKLKELKNELVNKSKSRVGDFNVNHSNKPVTWGSIYYANLNGGQGSEQNGVRPVIVIQNDIGNNFSPTVIIACITSKMTKAKLPTHVEISGYGLEKDSVILMETVRQIDKRRLMTYIGKVDDVEIIIKIERAIRINTCRRVGHETRVRKDIKQYIYNCLNKIENYNTTITTLKELNINSDDVEDKKFMEENNLMCYCNDNNVNYNNIVKDYMLAREEVQLAVQV